MQEFPVLNIVNTLTDLRTYPPSTNATVLLIGKATVGDGLGGFYRWDSSSVAIEDSTYLNTIVSSVPDITGRWVRVFQKVKVYPHGLMVTNGGVMTFYAGSTTNASGQSVINLTEDNTLSGVPLFSAVWQVNGQADASASTSNDVITGNGKVSADLKTATFTFSRGNSSAVGVLGLTVLGLRSAPASTPVRLSVTGIKSS